MFPHRAVIVAAVVAAGCGRPADRAPPPPPPPDEPPAEYVRGSAGCAGLACHGALDTSARGWRNAATVWERFDPHARAGRTLHGDAARRIVAALGESGSAHENAQCRACHVAPARAADPSGSEGVGCEACHTRPGQATGWVAAHKRGWAPGGLADCYATRGMNWLNDARGRAAACVGCHVGAPAGNGVPVRDVTHDLIAAGHPRLNFDYGTYLAALPAHWVERGRRATDGEPQARAPGAHAAAWAVGRFETARAAAALLADRADRAKAGGAWPDLAGYDCYSCHYAIGTGAPRRAAGSMVWNRAELPLLLGGPLANDADLVDLGRELSCRNPDADRVGSAAGRLAERFAAAVPPDDLLGCVRAALPALATADWDDQARAYYALAAVARDRGARTTEQDAAAARLRFPRPPVAPRANSPVGHDPAPAHRALASWADALR